MSIRIYENIQKLKNLSLITSISINSTKHLGNVKDSNTFVANYSGASSLINRVQYSNQRTPDEMKMLIDSSVALKTSPALFLDHSEEEEFPEVQVELYDTSR